MLEQHNERMAREATLIHEVPLPKGTAHGCFVAPAAYEIAGIQVLEREVFGPILHVVRYRADRLDQVLAALAGTGHRSDERRVGNESVGKCRSRWSPYPTKQNHK